MRVRVVEAVLPGGSGGTGGGGWDRNDAKQNKRAPRPVARWERVRLPVGVFDAGTPNMYELPTFHPNSWASFGKGLREYVFRSCLRFWFCLVCEKRDSKGKDLEVARHMVPLTKQTREKVLSCNTGYLAKCDCRMAVLALGMPVIPVLRVSRSRESSTSFRRTPASSSVEHCSSVEH